MNRIATIALSIAATLVTSGTALAQVNAAKATVPFNFTVGTEQMPAGTYNIGSASRDGILIQITARDRKVNILAMGRVEPNNPEQKAVLIFHHYGDRYFLSEVRYPHSSIKVLFVPTRTEKRAAKGILEGGLRVDNNVEVALNATGSAQSAGR